MIGIGVVTFIGNVGNAAEFFLIRVLFPSICRKLVLLLTAMKRNSGNCWMKDWSCAMKR
jgi:hypothetical protein